jgi:hypothetical protein
VLDNIRLYFPSRRRILKSALLMEVGDDVRYIFWLNIQPFIGFFLGTRCEDSDEFRMCLEVVGLL